VYRRPTVAIVSTGDELVPIEAAPTAGQIRDVNSTTLAALVVRAGCVPLERGIVPDELGALSAAARDALALADALLISGGSSVGARDYTELVLRGLPDAELLVQGVAVRPGKPTLLARAGRKPVWGLPGQVTSAMVVFELLVRPCLERLGGARPHGAARWPVRATLARNVPSVHGRTDLVRVRLERRGDELRATPVLGPSGLLRTMVEADGLVAVGQDVEGLYEGDEVWVTLL
jgi:molybdopterin molybdotransferase